MHRLIPVGRYIFVRFLFIIWFGIVTIDADMYLLTLEISLRHDRYRNVFSMAVVDEREREGSGVSSRWLYGESGSKRLIVV